MSSKAVVFALVLFPLGWSQLRAGEADTVYRFTITESCWFAAGVRSYGDSNWDMTLYDSMQNWLGSSEEPDQLPDFIVGDVNHSLVRSYAAYAY